MSKLVWKANYFYKFRVPTSMYQEKLLNKALHSKNTSSLISSNKEVVSWSPRVKDYQEKSH
jgi:hypothetical protein